MEGKKGAEREAAERVHELKQKLCTNIFSGKNINNHLVGLEHSETCAVCAREKWARAHNPDPEAPKIICKECKQEKQPPCVHLDKISKDYFAFDLCAPDKSVESFQFTTALGEEKNKRNMDIYTAQQVAMKRAVALHDRLCEPEIADALLEYQRQAKQEYLSRDLKYGDEYNDVRRIKVIMVGASVTAVTFHATLHQLMKKNPRNLRFNDLFVVKFIDIYLRPLERLMQARDRTVVPRYEYERLFETLIGEPERTRKGYLIADPTYWKKSSQEAKDAWDTSHPDMPPQLRWAPGKVRDVAVQIAEGHKRWFRTHGPRNNQHSITPYDALNQYLGNWFVGIREPVRRNDQRGQENDVRFFAIELNKYGNVPGGVSESDRNEREQTEVCGDILFRATGLGVDIAGDTVEAITLRDKQCFCGRDDNDIYDFPSEQRSYWDPIKPELDLQEENSKHILVVGNSDAAAGGLFSTLLTHFESCTFEVLAEMLWKCDEDGLHTELQEWFSDLQDIVNILRTTNDYQDLSVTDAWTKALQSEEIHQALMDSSFLRRENSDFLKKYIRSGRSLYLGILSQSDHDERLEVLKKQFGTEAAETPKDTFELRRSIRPQQRFIAAKFLEDAWPENRLLGFILRPYITVLMMDYSRDVDNPLEITRRSGRKKSTYNLEGSITEYGFGGADARRENRSSQELKYVLNCGGRPYFQLDGNIPVPARPGGEQDGESVTS